MNNLNLTNVDVNQAPKFVAVVDFLHSRSYHSSTKNYDFFCSKVVSQGDIVVVDTVNGLEVAKIVGIKSVSSNHRATKWVVDKVDVAAHKARMQTEEKLKTIKREMDKRAKALDEKAKFKLMAQSDAKMAALLAEYEAYENQMQGLAWSDQPKLGN